MKFAQLQIGQRFRYQDKVYRKATPLMAAIDGEDRQKLIPRSAVIEPMDAQPAEAAPVPAGKIPLAQLDQAMNQLASEINDIISESGLNAGEVNAVLRQMQAAFLKTRRHLNLP
jgi:hypothetical protein